MNSVANYSVVLKTDFKLNNYHIYYITYLIDIPLWRHDMCMFINKHVLYIFFLVVVFRYLYMYTVYSLHVYMLESESCMYISILTSYSLYTRALPNIQIVFNPLVTSAFDNIFQESFGYDPYNIAYYHLWEKMLQNY